MSDRFYPDNFPEFINEPRRSAFSIIHTSEKGEGIIAKRVFNTGDIVFTFTGVVIPFRELFTLEISPDLHIFDPYFMGKVLHSCDPNMRADMKTLTFYATRKIEVGEFLTMDYESTESKLYREFNCKCGSSNCRKVIKGYAER